MKNLEERLKTATFDGCSYFLNLAAGCYNTSNYIFDQICQHPSIKDSYRVRVALSNGFYDKENILRNFTVLKSVGTNFLEFTNGVVIVKNFKGVLE